MFKQQGVDPLMIIKKLNIISFGKLKNKSIELKDGINIIYGRNEAGKSTIQSFIKAMLYGMNSQKKSIRENGRKRYMPWSGERAQGELIYEDDGGNGYIIRRSFGNTKKEDQGEIIHFISGEKLRAINVIEPGKEILGLNEEGFNKTLFIEQLGLEINKGKEDEILEKLTNLAESGDEDRSYEKAIKTLEEAKKIITTPRKSGKLDELRLKLISLNTEYKESLRLSDENIEEQIELNNLKDKRTYLRANIEKLELYKKHIKRIKLYKEYGEILEYLKKSNELNEKIEEVEEGLVSDEGSIDNQFISSLKEEYRAYKQLKDIEMERLENKDVISNSLKVKEDEFCEYEKFNNLDEDVERKVISLCLEKKNLEEKIKKIEIIDCEIEDLNKDLEKLKDKHEKISYMSDINSKIQGVFYDYENKLKELKYKISKDNIDFEILDKKQVYKNKKTLNFILSISFFIIILLLSFIKGFGIYKVNLIYVPIIILFIALIISVKRYKDQSKTLHNIEKEELLYGDISNLKNSIITIEEDLKRYYKLSGSKDHEDFLIKIKDYNDNKEKIDKITIKIEEKLLSRSNYSLEVLEEEYENICRYIDFILEDTNSHDIEDFLDRYKIFKEINKNIDILKSEVRVEALSLEHISEEINIKEKNIKNTMDKINKSHINIESIPTEIEKLEEKLKEKQEIEGRLKSIESNYELLLKDRDLEKMKEEIGDIINEDIEENFKNEEDLDDAIREKNKELLYTEKRLRDVKNSIDNKFIGKRTIIEIEEEIDAIKIEIELLEYRLEYINIAYDTLIECFKELQRDFGPILNEKVSKVFSSIVIDNYEEVKVSEDYGLKVRDKDRNDIIEAEYLSNGTVDQIYFSLRMAFIDLIFDGEEIVPIFLDEAFMQYDDERLLKALEYIKTIDKNRQIIIFTCQKREVDILKKDSNIVYL